ncbi:MAG: transcriptional repressor NrdR [Candidatus Aenigmarchaeota archaeon]|nr:transcriptional repressor NrdR [Candidatus Aenigmarchaeota archaeon]
MKCIYCANDTKVIDKRDAENIIRRRRECLSCSKRFTTYEKAHVTLTVVKKNNEQEKFDRQKLITGLQKACEKRPIPEEVIESIADEIEIELMSIGEEVTSKKIGDIVMQKLEKLDKIAYVRFASVYKNFDSISQFEKTVKTLKSN